MTLFTKTVITGLATCVLGGAVLADEPIEATAAVRAALDEYVATAAFPDSGEVDPALFADDIVAFWSNGRVCVGRQEMVRVVEEAQAELEQEFASFSGSAQSVSIHVQGDLAWLTCELHFSGAPKQGTQPFRRAVRSTFVFEQRDNRWQMVHEHSSRVREGM